MSWKKVPGLVCMHCGREMESDISQSRGSIVIVGIEPMIYRHADDHTSECAITTRHKAEPYSEWGQQDKWTKAGEESSK